MGRFRSSTLKTVALCAMAMLTLSASARAQTTAVTNPTTLSFTASSDHDAILAGGQPVVDHYSFDVYSVGAASPFQQTNIGKPTPAADGTIVVDFSGLVAGWPLPGGTYEARVVAIGPSGNGVSTPSNPFAFGAAPCSVTIAGTAATLPAAGGGTQFAVTAAAGCAWTAASDSAWIAVTPSSGSGSATVVLTMAVNATTALRTGSVSVAGQTFTVTQLGASCAFSLSLSSQAVPAAGGTGTIDLSAGTGCGWTAASNAAWVSLSPASGSGSATLTYTVGANTATTPRTGTLTIAGATFTINQAAAAAAAGVPSPWSTQDVGNTVLAGSASCSSGTYTLAGSGADIWGAADAFRFVYQPMSGDVQIVARVVDETNTNSYAKAGIMLRGGLTASAPHVFLDLRPNGSIEFMTRSASGTSTTLLATSTQAAPAWLRLSRAGGAITAAVSADGVTWKAVGSTATALGTNVSAGLVVGSHDTALLNTARFDNVSVTAMASSLPSPWTTQDVGAVGLAGSASYASGMFTVSGSGADIWGTADAFRYVLRPSGGDGQIVARMTGQQNTNAHAKAGVMYRIGLGANAAFVILDVTPGGSLEFMSRTAAGASVAYLGGTTQAAPVWLRLARSGSTVTASVSADGSRWRTVGSTRISLGTAASVGLAVTSHDNSVRNVATFDNVTVR